MFQHQSPTYFTQSADPKSTQPNHRLAWTSHVNLPRHVSQPINDLAIDFFLSTHVFREYGYVRGHYEYLSGLGSEIRSNKTLLMTISAVALAAYAYKFWYPALLQQARRHYGHALQLINTALSVREEIIKDSTIISILLLGTFETVTSGNQKSFSHCEAHIRGAMATISIRGHHIVTSRRGQQLFLHMCWCLSVNCIVHSIQIPKELVSLRRYATSYLDANNPAWRLLDISFKLAKFRADVKTRVLSDYRSIVDVAFQIDRELFSLANDMPIQWRFQTVSVLEQSELVFGTKYHVYPDLWVASIWNAYRTCRLLLHQEIRTQLTYVLDTCPQSFTPMDMLNYQSSTDTLQQLALGIYATVPQFCGHISLPSGCLIQTEGIVSQDPLIGGIPTTAGVYFLFWPLFSAGQTIDCEMQRKWIVDRSRYIGRTTGLQQAFALADLIENREELSFSD